MIKLILNKSGNHGPVDRRPAVDGFSLSGAVHYFEKLLGNQPDHRGGSREQASEDVVDGLHGMDATPINNKTKGVISFHGEEPARLILQAHRLQRHAHPRRCRHVQVLHAGSYMHLHAQHSYQNAIC